jgi:hypothetical protein
MAGLLLLSDSIYVCYKSEEQSPFFGTKAPKNKSAFGVLRSLPRTQHFARGLPLELTIEINRSIPRLCLCAT